MRKEVAPQSASKNRGAPRKGTHFLRPAPRGEPASCDHPVRVRRRCPHRKTGGPERDQTADLVVANDALYQLSYRPEQRLWYWEIVARK